MEEKELVAEYRASKELMESLEEQLKEAKDRFEKAQKTLVDDLKLRQATQTAKYDGLGRVTLKKPIVGARSTDEDALFAYLKQIGREDLIKQTVHHRTLSAFVKESLENGTSDSLPVFIEYWFKDSTMLTK